MEYQSVIRSQLEQVLQRVIRPARYVGGELNMIKKDPGQQNIKVCLAFPDIYDIGQSYIGFYILYNILNKRRATLCERTFAPWTDMEEIMRGENIPLWSLESFLPVSSFDVVGFTLQYELHYATVLNMLDLAGIPLKAAERSETDPLVFGGGPCCINPEPVAEFFDAFLLGDGEEAFPEMLDVIERSRASGRSRHQTLNDLSAVRGVYVPSLYKPLSGRDSSFAGMESSDGAQLPVTARFVERLKPEYYPDHPLVPLCEIVHDRLAVELMRGCTRGCRFCSAGMCYRPKRERPVQEVVGQVVANIENTGWEEVSLVSLSTSDYTGLEELVRKIGNALGDRMVTVSLSSLRADNFSIAMADAVAGGRKSSLTFAPEAGTQRLRDVINKNLTEEQLFETLKTALGGGWNGFKLYFMIGLPTETDEDVIAIACLLNRIHALLRHYKGQRVNVTLSSFSPKPMTPFQWEPQNSVEELTGKIRLIRQRLRARSVNLKTDDPLVSMLECRIGRGGRELGAVILDAWKRGARLDGWSEHFSADVWKAAFEKTGIALEHGGGGAEPGSPMPWSHLSFGVTESFLRAERGKAIRGEWTPDCQDQCQGCGPYAPFCAGAKRAAAPPGLTGGSGAEHTPQEKERVYGRKKRVIITRSATPYLSGMRFRIKFAKRSAVRFTSHLDLVRLFDRTMRRAGIPVAYSQGFHPHPKISFGPPLPLGMKSLAEYADFSLRTPFPPVEENLSKELADGFDLIGIRPIPEKAESLSSIVSRAEYYVPATIDNTLMEGVKDILGRTEIPVERMTKKGLKTIDIRPGVLDISVAPDDSGLILLLSSGPENTVKPSEVLELLFDGKIPDGVTRTEQYAVINGTRVTPLDIVR